MNAFLLALLPAAIHAYADRASLDPGDVIAFKVSDSTGSLFVPTTQPYSIARAGFPGGEVLAGTIPVRRQNVPSDASQNGCDWDTTLSILIPSTWTPGLYTAHFGSGSDAESDVDFVVRSFSPRSPIVLQVPITTRAAYNRYGGESLYTNGTSNNVVSLDRPDDGTDDTAFLVKEFIVWAERDRGLALDYLTSVDLDADSSALLGYQLFVTVGHDEYWSRPMRDRFDTFVRTGGHAAIFSGNTMYWQIRYSADRRQIICYKDESDPVRFDPLNQRYTTVRWYQPPVNFPTQRSIGLGYDLTVPLESGQAGGAAEYESADPTSPAYKVIDSSSWVYEGTGLANGHFFGSSIVGYETDALVFWRLTNIPVGSDGAPNNFKILARANLLNPAWDPQGWAIFGLFDHGGTVFNAASVDWAAALTGDGAFDRTASRPKGESYDAFISSITANVIDRLSRPRTALQRNTMTVHRYWMDNGAGGTKALLSTSPFIESGWEYDGTDFYALRDAAGGTSAVYQFSRAYGGGRQYRYSRSTSLSGWTRDELAFHAYSATAAGRVPIYEYWAANTDGTRRHQYSSDPSFGLGWTQGSIVFYGLSSN